MTVDDRSRRSSRSGSTSEALLAAEHLASAPNVTVVGVTCNVGSRLATACDHTIELPGAAERSVAMTQSFTTMLLALQIVAALVANDADFSSELARLPALGDGLMPDSEEFACSLGDDGALHQFIYLGLGQNYASPRKRLWSSRK